MTKVIQTLGFFKKDDSVFFVESQKGTAVRPVTIPLTLSEEGGSSVNIPLVTKQAGLIQKGLEDSGMSQRDVHLSLPVKDIIFRSFTIPWMKPDEVKNVVSFEATKYIPIQLEALAYNYYSVAFSEGKQRLLRILFVAVRKEILDYYKELFQQSNLNIASVEPSPVSLARVLRKSGALARSKSTAIIEMGETGGTISILENTIIQFIRDFQMPADLESPQDLHAKLFNDIRISFNFFKRQNPNGQADKIVIVSQTPQPDLAPILENEFNLPVAVTSTRDILPESPSEQIGMLHAYGASIRDIRGIEKYKNFELSGLEKPGSRSEASINWAVSKNFKVTAGVVMACIIACSLFVFFSKKMVTSYNNKLFDLQEKKDALMVLHNDLKRADLPVSKIKSETKSLGEKLKNYQNIKTNSETGFFLFKITQHLPEGIWLTKLSFRQEISAVRTKKTTQNVHKNSITFTGLAYFNDRNREFQEINQFVGRLQEDQDFSKQFSEIVLQSVNQSKSGTTNLTVFQIQCQ